MSSRRSKSKPAVVAAAANDKTSSLRLLTFARFETWISLFLFVTIVFAYWPSLSSRFIWDDDYYVTENSTLRTLAGLCQIWVDPRATPQYYPLVHTSFWIEYHLWGLQPQGYHFINVLLHATNSVLVAQVLRRLQVPGAWLAAAVFGLHPVHVESVAWVTERKNVLSALFYLLAMQRFLDWWDIRNITKRVSEESVAPQQQGISNYILGVLLFVAALLSKSVTCSLPAVLVLIIWQRQGYLTRRDILHLVPLFIIGLLLAINTIWLERTNVGASGTGFHWTMAERALIAGNALWFYAAKLVCPVDLAFIYPRWKIDVTNLTAWCVTLSAVLLPLWFVFRYRGMTAPLVAILYFGGTLFPALGFFNIYPMRYSYVADHFQYLASLGLISLLAALLARAVPIADKVHGKSDLTRWLGHGWTSILLNGENRTPVYTAVPHGPSPLEPRNPFPIANELLASVPSRRSSNWIAVAHMGLVIAILVGLASLTWQRQFAFRNPQVLWEDTLAKNPTCMLAHIHLGKMAVHAQDYLLAEKHFRDVERFRTDDIGTHCNESDLGVALAGQRRFPEAIAMFQSALARVPNYFEALNGWGTVAAQQGQLETAISLFEKSLAEKPSQVFARRNLGMALLQTGRLEAADRELRRVLKDTPPDMPVSFLFPVHFMLTQILARQGKLTEAEKSARVVVNLDPTSIPARELLEQIEQDLRKRTHPTTRP